jgi:ankyrin repeat protein
VGLILNSSPTGADTNVTARDLVLEIKIHLLCTDTEVQNHVAPSALAVYLLARGPSAVTYIIKYYGAISGIATIITQLDYLSSLNIADVRRLGKGKMSETFFLCRELPSALCRELPSAMGIIPLIVPVSEVINYMMERPSENYIHMAVGHANITSRIVEFLMDIIEWSDAGQRPANRRPDDDGYHPIHILCENTELDAGEAIKILNLLVSRVDRCAEEWTETNGSYGEELPIHIAIRSQMSSSFIVTLYREYHDTPQQPILIDIEGTRMTPIIHHACRFSREVNTIKAILDADPGCINNTDRDGSLPIHHAVAGAFDFSDVRNTEIIKLLLEYRMPNYNNDLTNDNECPFHWLDRKYWLSRGPGQGSELVPTLYEAYPEAFLALYQTHHSFSILEPLPFFQKQFEYYQKYHNCTELPLHRALLNNEPLPLGTIKLLVSANAECINEKCPNTSAYPLHLACQFSTLNVVKYLVGENNAFLREGDSEGNYPLHYACIGGNLQIIYYLMKQSSATMSISAVNTDGDLPIHLLIKYAPSAFNFTSITFLVLQAMPQTVSQWEAIDSDDGEAIDSDDEDLFWSDQEDLSDDDQPY